MRKPKYLSPTSVSTWDKDRCEYYRKYLCEKRIPHMAQTEPMAVGSAFDAYIKNYLAKCLGMPEATGELDLDFLLTEQVEAHNRDFGISAGLDCFNQYKTLGATAELMKELETASDKPFFESTREATVEGKVPLLGKPDLYFWNKAGSLVIYDWKVNGYCSASNTSPRKGYVRLLQEGKPRKVHKMVDPFMIEGVMMDVSNTMEELDVSWAAQLAIYGWVLGGIGKPIIAGIDQLACTGGKIRVASLRNRIGEEFQDNLWAKCKEIWERIESGRIFDTDNDATIKRLDMEAGAYVMDSGEAKEDWYNGMMRKF